MRGVYKIFEKQIYFLPPCIKNKFYSLFLYIHPRTARPTSAGRYLAAMNPTVEEPLFSDYLFQAPTRQTFQGDARRASAFVAPESVDLIFTSPPYWKKRDYGYPEQIGQEATAEAYIDTLVSAMRDWRKVLRKTGSVFINVGDTYHKRSLAGVPGLLEAAALRDGWIVRNRIIWMKRGGMPEPARDRLASRHEYIFHFVRARDYYYDLFAYAQRYGNGANPGDVWETGLERDTSGHLAPFPEEIVARAITLACPMGINGRTGRPIQRIVERTHELDENRPQARRAMELARERGLTPAHINAIQATGITDAGKAQQYQSGTGRNAAEVQRLAAEAKAALGGYFREFTFAKKRTVGWTVSDEEPVLPGVVLDPFMGTGTTLRVAEQMGRSAIGIDAAPSGLLFSALT
jgi:DNA modification methylase